MADNLIELSNQQVEEALDGLSETELKELSGHLDKIIRILDGDENGDR